MVKKNVSARIYGAYACRQEIKAVGGKFNGGPGWEVTEGQLLDLIEQAAASFRRSNKRDRALGMAFASVTIEREGEPPQSGESAMAPVLERLSEECAAYHAKHGVQS